MGVLVRLGLLDSTVPKVVLRLPALRAAHAAFQPDRQAVDQRIAALVAGGLPLGMQFAEPFGSKDRLLQLAQA